MSRKPSRIFAGILLIVLGLVFFLKVLGVLNFSVWKGFGYYWPIGLILVGVALIFRMRWLAVTFLFLTLLFGALYIGSEISTGEYRTVTKSIAADDITHADIQLKYGAGDMTITDGGSDLLLQHTAKTVDTSDPDIQVRQTGDTADIVIERKSTSFRFWNSLKDQWDIKLSPDVEFNLDLDYGASDSSIDLENLRVAALDLDTGAASTEIIFGTFPTKSEIDTGASSITLKFPKDIGVEVEVDGGAVSTNLQGFTRESNRYFSDNYDPNGENIEVKIDAGATSIEGSFY